MPDIVEIERLSNDGRGIAHVNGKVVFVSGGLPGESVRIDIRKHHKRFDEAEVAERISSPHAAPPCRHFESCGGCDWMRLDDDVALDTKAGLVRQAFERLLNEELGDRWLAPIPSQPLGYRCRVKLKLREGAAGYFTAGTHRFAPIDTCLVATESIQKAIPRLSADAGRFLAEGFQEVELRAGPDDERPIAVLSGKGRVPGVPEYLRGAASGNERRGQTNLEYEVAGIRLTAGPGSFVQVNLGINEKLVTDVIALAGEKADVVDAFCGIGNFAIPLARKGHRVLGMEGSKDSISDAEENARRNKATATWACVPESRMVETWKAVGFSPTATLVIDPPRAGAKLFFSQMKVARLQPNKVLYISCDPGTLLRDAGELITLGYKLETVRTYDMFPQTHHIETLAQFTR